MLTPGRALTISSDSGRKMPEIPTLQALYDYGLTFRHGQTVMIAGRSGSQKSGFAMWLCLQWGLPVLYFSGDMKPATASFRLASSITGDTTEEIETAWDMGGAPKQRVLDSLLEVGFTFAFGSPITWRAIDEELDAYVELWDAYPQVVVYDNLMDIEGCESDYTAQMGAMQRINELAMDTEASSLVLHHASDKTWNAENEPWRPPSRQEVKGGLSEKPEISLGVALNPHTLDFNVAVLKQRSGPQDPTARSYKTLRCEPTVTRFHRL